MSGTKLKIRARTAAGRALIVKAFRPEHCLFGGLHRSSAADMVLSRAREAPPACTLPNPKPKPTKTKTNQSVRCRVHGRGGGMFRRENGYRTTRELRRAVFISGTHTQSLQQKRQVCHVYGGMSAASCRFRLIGAYANPMRLQHTPIHNMVTFLTY